MDTFNKDKKMKRVWIGIDSCDNLRYSIVVAGPEDAVRGSHREIAKILGDANVKKMHFSDIDRKILKNTSESLGRIIKDSKTVSFRVFEHKKPVLEPYKNYFLDYVPEEMANYLKSFDKYKNRLIQIDIHNDYTVKGVQNSSHVFADRLIRKLSRKMIGEGSGIKILKNGKIGLRSSKMITKNKNYIKIRTRVLKHQDSEAINLADMSLGFFKRYRKMVDSKIKYKKI